MSVNPNVPSISQPVADLAALTSVAIQLRQGMLSLAGQTGGPLDRAATMRDLQNAVITGGGSVGSDAALTARVTALEGQMIAAQAAISTLQSDVNQLAARHTSANMASAATVPGSSSTTYVMMGVNAAFHPTFSQRGFFTVNGLVGNTTVGGVTTVQLCYGVGTPPVNGAPITGTLIGQPTSFTAEFINGNAPFAQSSLITGVTIGTAYWIDLALRVTTGTGVVANVNITAFDMLDPFTLT